MTDDGLNAVFTPASVALYGASATDPARLGNTLLANARRGLADVVAVHPRADQIDGVHAVPSLDRQVDLALISVPARSAADAVADAGRSGARAAIVLSSGFAEAGPDGVTLQRDLVAVARRHHVRLVGPNCMGVVSRLPGELFNGSYFWSVPDAPGPIAFVSQSGAMGGMFLAAVRKRSLGFARFLSIGNASDVTAADALAWLGEDPLTDVIGIFLEGPGDGRRLVEVARTVTQRKPVIVLKGGKSEAGARAAASHTGSLVGPHRLAQAAFRRAGMREVPSTTTLFDALQSMAAPTLRLRSRHVAVVTVSGGPGVLAADAATAAGLRLPAPRRETVDRLRALLPSFAATVNPYDLTPQCPATSFAAAFAAIADDPGVDGAVVINCGLDIPEFAEGAGTLAAQVPTTAFVLDVPKVETILRGLSMALFDGPEQAAGALAVRLSEGAA